MLSGLRGEIGALRHELVILQLGNASPRFTPKQVWHRFFVPFWGGEEGTILWARNRLQWLGLESLKTQDAHAMTTDFVSKANGMGWC